MAKRLDKLLAAAEVADVLGITLYAARKRMQRGQLPAVKMGRQWRVKQSALQAYIASLPTNNREDTR
jgi:excisionase family DNA binding protein